MDGPLVPPPNPVRLVALVFRSAALAREHSHGSRANEDGEEGFTGHRGEVLCQIDLGLPEAWQRGVWVPTDHENRFWAKKCRSDPHGGTTTWGYGVRVKGAPEGQQEDHGGGGHHPLQAPAQQDRRLHHALDEAHWQGTFG